MKNLRLTFYALSFLLLNLFAIAHSAGQVQDETSPEDLKAKAEISAARCLYTQADEGCAAKGEAAQFSGASKNDATVAQLPRHRLMPPQRPGGPVGRPGPAYSRGWPEPPNRAVAIGALVGFGLGAAAGATANTDAHGRVLTSLLGGSLGALMGAAFGHAVSGLLMITPHNHNPWPDEDESASHSLPDSRLPSLASPQGN
jgi:hypothetical protein